MLRGAIGIFLFPLFLMASIGPDENPSRTDLYGDPLPDGAIARMGSGQFRHPELINCVLPDNKSVITVGRDRLIRYWELMTGRLLRTVKLEGTSRLVRNILLTPDGKTLVAVDDANEMNAWDTDTGAIMSSFPVPKETLDFHLQISPDGNTIVGLPMRDPVVHIWERATGKERVVEIEPQSQRDSSGHVYFSPDGKCLVVSWSSKHDLHIFDVATGRKLRSIDCHATASAISPVGSRLAVASALIDGMKRGTIMRFYDLATGNEVAQFPMGNEAYYYSLTFAPDGKTLACGYSKQSCLIECATGRVLHRWDGRQLWFRFSPDGKTLVIGDHEGLNNRLQIWDVATEQLRFDRPGDVGQNPVLAVSPDGQFLVSAYQFDSAVRVWDNSSGRLLRSLYLEGKERLLIRNLNFASEGRTLLGCRADALQLWDVASGEKLRAVQLEDSARPKLNFLDCYGWHLSADGGRLACLEGRSWASSVIHLDNWDSATGKIISHRSLGIKLDNWAWFPDNSAVAIAGEGRLRVVDADNAAIRFDAPGVVTYDYYRMLGGLPLALSPDARLVVAATDDPDAKSGPANGVTVWETASGNKAASLRCGRVAHLAMLADNRTLIATDDSCLRVWDLATLEERRHWQLPTNVTDAWGNTMLTRLLLSPDGRRAFTSLADGTALVWDLTPALHARPQPAGASEQDLNSWWDDLASEDAKRAYAAIWRFVDAPADSAVSFLGRRLQPLPVPTEAQIQLHIRALDSEAFAKRETAAKELETLGRVAVPAMRDALDQRPSLEKRRRLEKLLELPYRLIRSTETLRSLRAIEVLERIGSANAKQALARLAAGAAYTPDTQEAKAALDRLGGR